MNDNDQSYFITEEEKAQIVLLGNEGKDNAFIAKKLNRDRQYIGKILRKLGIGRRHNTPLVITENGTGLCDVCSKEKTLSAFTLGKKGGKTKSRFLKTCNACRNNRRDETINKSIESYLRYRIHDLKTKTKSKKILFNLTYEYLLDLFYKQEGKCFYTEVKLPTARSSSASLNGSLSVDKIIPELGYTQGNVVLCTSRANQIKHNQTPEELKKWMPSWYKKLVKADFVIVV